MTTGISQPFIRASEPAEAYARAFSFAVALPPAEQQGADRRAVLSAQADLRDGGVVRDLTLK